MYGEITCLTQSTGECFASNNYFAKLYEVSKETISRWISNLKKQGYIDIKITYKKNSKTIDKRIITLLTKKSIGYCENNQYPIDEKVKDNNTSINNTSINTYEEVSALWNQFAIKHSKSKIIKLSSTRKKKIDQRDKDFKDLLVCVKIGLEKASNSDFLLNSDFFSFDWLFMNDNNLLKILEDKYTNKNEEWGGF